MVGSEDVATKVGITLEARPELLGAAGAVLPLSSLLNSSLPIVELESSHLNDSIAWLYEAVQTLQERDAQLESKLLRCTASIGQQLFDGGSGGAPATEGCPQSYVDSLPGGASELDRRIWRLETDVRRMVDQQDRKRAAEEQLLEMRIDSIKCELDNRPGPKDLEGLKVHLAQKLQALESKTREDVGLLGSMLHNEGASDRRRLTLQFEALQRRLQMQIELTEAQVREQAQKEQDERLRLEQRLVAAEAIGGPDGRLHDVEERLLRAEDRLHPVEEVAGRTSAPAASVSELAGVSNAGVSNTDGVDAIKFGDRSATGRGLESEELKDLRARVGQLETRVASPATEESQSLCRRLDELEAVAFPAGVSASPMVRLPSGGGGTSTLQEDVAGGTGEQQLHTELARFSSTNTADSLGLALLSELSAAAGAEGDTGSSARSQLTIVQLQGLLVSLYRMQEDGRRDVADLVVRIEQVEGSLVQAEALQFPQASAEGSLRQAEALHLHQASAEEPALAQQANGLPEASPSPGMASPISPLPGRGPLSPGADASARRRGPLSPGADAGARRISALEQKIAELENHIQEREVAERQNNKSEADRWHRHSRSMQLLARYVVGIAGSDCSDAGTQPGSRSATPQAGGAPSSVTSNSTPVNNDPLAWLEKNRHSIGLCMETRLKDLETISGGDLGTRLSKVEQRLKRIDVESLDTTLSSFQQYQQEQQVVGNDLRREVMELKTVVGCIEACVPKETRKAIQLFKRAAGAEGAARQITPRTLDLEGKFLNHQQDVETRLAEAESRIADQCTKVTTVVKSLQYKQDNIRAEMTDLNEQLEQEFSGGASRLGSRPGSSHSQHSVEGAPPGSQRAQGIVGRPLPGGRGPPAGWSSQSRLSSKSSRRPSREPGVGIAGRPAT